MTGSGAHGILVRVPQVEVWPLLRNVDSGSPESF